MRTSICVLLIITAFSCKNSNVENHQEYNKDISKIFEAHGGIDTWNDMHMISYEIVKEGGNEKQVIDLKNRNERIDASNFTMGYDGKNFWLEADSTYKGNPIFYKNLMFYFYAMPFVLGDPGIIYTETKELEYNGKLYPGIKISYESGVGVSSDDEYFIHYNPTTYQMEWLGYTVTYFSKEKSKKISWIRYDDWQEINDLRLPKSLAWYNVEENLPIDERSRREFINVQLNQESLDSHFFTKTENATIIEE